jgi:hypothetical protein
VPRPLEPPFDITFTDYLTYDKITIWNNIIQTTKEEAREEHVERFLGKYSQE